PETSTARQPFHSLPTSTARASVFEPTPLRWPAAAGRSSRGREQPRKATRPTKEKCKFAPGAWSIGKALRLTPVRSLPQCAAPQQIERGLRDEPFERLAISRKCVALDARFAAARGEADEHSAHG